MMSPQDVTLTCQGRPVDDNNQPVGEPCGRTLTVRGNPGTGGFTPTPDLSRMVWVDTTPPTPPTDGQVRDRAIAAGWNVAGPAPMCPRCRKSDPAITRGLT